MAHSLEGDAQIAQVLAGQDVASGQAGRAQHAAARPELVCRHEGVMEDEGGADVGHGVGLGVRRRHGPPYESAECGQVRAAVLAKLSCYPAANSRPYGCKGMLAEELPIEGGEMGLGTESRVKGNWARERQE